MKTTYQKVPRLEPQEILFPGAIFFLTLKIAR
jgi:hypothetical protein